MSTPVVQFGTVAILAVTICEWWDIYFFLIELFVFFYLDAGYKMMCGGDDMKCSKKNEHCKQAVADSQGTVVKK